MDGVPLSRSVDVGECPDLAVTRASGNVEKGKIAAPSFLCKLLLLNDLRRFILTHACTPEGLVRLLHSCVGLLPNECGRFF